MVEFHVLRCVDCQTFQVLQVTKSSKWKCKLCGQKQSIIKVYGQGTGADCRKRVQKLNRLRGEICDAVEEKSLLSASVRDNEPNSFEDPYRTEKNNLAASCGSRWSSFMENTDDQDQVDAVLKNSAADSDNDNGSRFQVTTDWAEYQQVKKRKRAEMRTEYSHHRTKSQKMNDYQTGFDEQKNFAFENEHGSNRWKNKNCLFTNNRINSSNRNIFTDKFRPDNNDKDYRPTYKSSSATGAMKFVPLERNPLSLISSCNKSSFQTNGSAQGNELWRNAIQGTDMKSTSKLPEKQIQGRKPSAKSKTVLSKNKKEKAVVSSKWGEFLEDEEDEDDKESDDDSDQLYFTSNDFSKPEHQGNQQDLDSSSFSPQQKTSFSFETNFTHQDSDKIYTGHERPIKKSLHMEQRTSEQVNYKATSTSLVVDDNNVGMFELGYNLEDEDFVL